MSDGDEKRGVQSTKTEVQGDSGAPNIGQGTNANGEQDAKDKAPDLSAGELTIGGVTKITRHAGTPPEEKKVENPVQQTGGGTVDALTGKPV